MPELVLMDIQMPVMDGVQAAREIRQLCDDFWLPIIFLSAKDAEANQREVLRVGDDFLPKPVNLGMLEAKIGVMARIAEMQRRLADDARRLETYRLNNEADLQFAHELYDEIVGYRDDASGRLKCWVKPANHLSGDIIVQVGSATGPFYLMLADSTGHGLAAAICALPAIDAFIAMANKGHEISAIAREINGKLKRLLPTGHFVCAALICVDPQQHEVQVWNGGIPLVAFIADRGQILRQWPSRQPALGALRDADFDATTERWKWPEAGQVIVCSDGVIEAESEAGERVGHERVLATMTGAGADAFNAVIADVDQVLQGRERRDDMSLAALRCSYPQE
jgi:serine phosphatase RsbU (regulator of sigma subunit)